LGPCLGVFFVVSGDPDAPAWGTSAHTRNLSLLNLVRNTNQFRLSEVCLGHNGTGVFQCAVCVYVPSDAQLHGMWDRPLLINIAAEE